MLIGEFGAAAREQSEKPELDTFRFYGETFAVADRVGAMPMLRFAAVAESGVDADEMEGLAAMHELLRDCLVAEPVTEEGDDGEVKVVAHGWARFAKVASDNKVSADELMEICAAVYQSVTGKDTPQPSASPVGQSPTGPTSRAPSSSEGSSPLGSVPPILLDPRVRELKSVNEVGMSLVG